MLKVNGVVNNPKLNYKLDPGEPGMLRSARASESFMKVTAQEQRNIRRMEFEARKEGRMIIKSEIKYSFGISGSYSSLKAGQSMVVAKKTINKQVNNIKKNIPEIQNKNEVPEKKALPNKTDNFNNNRIERLVNNPDELNSTPVGSPNPYETLEEIDESLDETLNKNSQMNENENEPQKNINMLDIYQNKRRRTEIGNYFDTSI